MDENQEEPLSEVEQYAATARATLTFNERYGEIEYWVDKRRRRIDLQNLPWDDVRQLLIVRVWKQYPAFDPARGEFRRWVNTVISNEIRNIWRDWYSHMARPCVTGKGGCPFNAGGNLCSKTPSGLQCGECLAFRDWEERKGDQYAIAHPVPLEMPSQDGSGPAVERSDVHNPLETFVDYEEKIRQLHAQVKKRLTTREWKAYRLLIVKNKEPREVAKAMGFKQKRGASKPRMFPGYLQVLAMRHRFEALARAIVEEKGIMLEDDGRRGRAA